MIKSAISKPAEMDMAMATPVQCKANSIGCVGHANSATPSAHPFINSPPRFSWAVYQASPIIRTRAILHPLACSDIHFFKGTMIANCRKRRPWPCKVVGSSKIVAQDSDFAEQETLKFKEGLLKKLAEDQKFSHQEVREQVAETCTKIFRQFVMNYRGSLLVAPFADMKAALDEEGLPGSSKAARAALVWAQDHLEDDWKEWSSTTKN